MPEPGLALCSLATSPSASAASSFAVSVQAFERGRHLFLGADATGAEAVRTAWTQPLSLLHVIDVPAQFHNRDRERLTRYGKWAEFQMLKADVLRRALSAGHASALYLDCDVLLLAPLAGAPRVSSPACHVRPRAASTLASFSVVASRVHDE